VGRPRHLVAIALAVVVVVGMVVGDAVTLLKAAPSFRNETRAINRLLPPSTKTTTTTTTTTSSPVPTTP
jgi:hypothetical protein